MLRPNLKSWELIRMDRDPSPCQEDRWAPIASTFERQRAIEWNPSRLGLFRTDAQIRYGASGVWGTEIEAAALTQSAPLPNINMFDYLKSNPHQAPEWARDDWYIFFIKPKYRENRDRENFVFVRYLHWNQALDGFEEGDVLLNGAGFTARCGLATYQGIRPY